MSTGKVQTIISGAFSLFFLVKFKINPYLLARSILKYSILKKYDKEAELLHMIP